jgi:cytochrome c biogenesis protein CcdA
MNTLLEGVEASAQPCTLAVLLPALAVVVGAGRRALWAWGGFVLACSLVFWARAAGYWDLDHTGAMRGVVAVLALAGFALVWRRGSDRAELTVPGGLVAGTLAGWLWRPCVGEQLADVLNSAPDEGPRTLVLTVVYVVGVVLVPLAVALLPVVVTRLDRIAEHPAWRGSAVVFGVAYAALIAAGRYDDVVAELLQRSSL